RAPGGARAGANSRAQLPGARPDAGAGARNRLGAGLAARLSASLLAARADIRWALRRGGGLQGTLFRIPGLDGRTRALQRAGAQHRGGPGLRAVEATARG